MGSRGDPPVYGTALYSSSQSPWYGGKLPPPEETLLYMGGTPLTDQCPVVVRSAAGVWTAVGGSSQLRGSCRGLAAVEYPDGQQLIANGVLSVFVNPSFVDCDVAMWDGATWVPVGFVGGLDTAADRASTGDHFGRTVDDAASARGLIGGNITEVASTLVDVGTEAATPAFFLAEWHRTTAWATMPDGGVNDILITMGNAGEILFPRPPG